jgi:hypothetical protein
VTGVQSGLEHLAERPTLNEIPGGPGADFFFQQFGEKLRRYVLVFESSNLNQELGRREG